MFFRESSYLFLELWYDTGTITEKDMKYSQVLLPVLTSLCLAVKAGGVYDDALFWFRGLADWQGDGVLRAEAVVNSAQAKGDAAQGCQLLGTTGALGVVADDVCGRFTGITNANWGCIRAVPANPSAYVVIDPMAGRETGTLCNAYTVMARFKWDGTLPSDNVVPVLNCGQHWMQKRGWSLGFAYDATTGRYTTKWDAGQRNNTAMGSKNTAAIPGFTSNVWFDVAVTCQWRDSNSVILNMYWSASEGKWSQFDWPRPWPSDAALVQTGLAPGNPVYMVPQGFTGEIAQYAIWPRILTVDEMREACASPNPAPALWRVGIENGRSDEFAASPAQAAAEIRVGGLWDEMTPALDATHREQAIRFDCPALYRSHNLGYVVRLVPAPSHARVSTRLTAYLNDQKIRYVNAIGTDAVQFCLPHGSLSAGENVFRLVYGGGAPLEIDVVEAVGSWVLGNYNWNTYKTEGCMLGTSDVAPYRLCEAYPNAIHGAFSADTGDAASTADTTLVFDVPADMTAHAYTFGISGNLWKAKPTSIRTYLNGELIDETTPWQFQAWNIAIPKGSFRPGTNTIQVRSVASDGSWWGGARGYRLLLSEFEPQPSGFGMTILVR